VSDEEKVKKIFLKVFDDLKEEDFDVKKKQQDYENWDSFNHMQIITEVESEFGVSLDVDEVTSIESAKDILTFLEKKGGQ
jgi:acyl carrier protein